MDRAADSAFYREPRWYACYTRARHEKRVAELLDRRGIESYLPLIPRESQWKDRKKTVLWPLFPSYVFGRFSLEEVHTVLVTPGVATIVRARGLPVAIPDGDLDNVRLFAQAIGVTGVTPEPRPFVKKGQWVRIMGGPFEGVEGVVIEERGRGRVMVGLDAIGQGLEVNIDVKLLKPIDRPSFLAAQKRSSPTR